MEFEMSVPKFRIKKNDLVMVINGKEKGKSGRTVNKGEEEFWKRRLLSISPM
jgi:hypothetical protein